jgi:hypothetical protein
MVAFHRFGCQFAIGSGGAFDQGMGPSLRLSSNAIEDQIGGEVGDP